MHARAHAPTGQVPTSNKRRAERNDLSPVPRGSRGRTKKTTITNGENGFVLPRLRPKKTAGGEVNNITTTTHNNHQALSQNTTLHDPNKVQTHRYSI